MKDVHGFHICSNHDMEFCAQACFDGLFLARSHCSGGPIMLVRVSQGELMCTLLVIEQFPCYKLANNKTKSAGDFDAEL